MTIADTMTPFDISLLRLARQKLLSREITSPQAIVAWMGAMQAQDFPMAKWAIGLRVPGTTDKAIDAALDRGDILRTHLLRPTWHFVAAEDIHWLLELTAPQIKAGQSSRDRQLELTGRIYARSNQLIEKALSARGQLSREELIVELNNGGIATDQNRASHLLMRAELEKIVCSGAILRGKPAYALLAERVPKPRKLTKEEALAELARRYFTSRSPATLQDFSWWSGLPAGNAKQAIDLVASELERILLDGLTYWVPRDLDYPKISQPLVHLLPTFDEYIISYNERSAAIAPELEQHMKEMSDRGVFWPIVLVDGRVIGTWRRTIKKDTLSVEIKLFSHIETQIMELIEQSAHHFANFLGKQLNFIY